MGILWVPKWGTLDARMNTQSTRIGIRKHWHRVPNWVLCVLAWDVQEGATWSNRPSWQ
jgi:hypothetical protein